MKHALVLLTILFFAASAQLAVAQTPADSVTITFVADQPSSPTMYVPGQFNNWGPNASGVIAANAISEMTYTPGLGIWFKQYVFKIHDAVAARTIADSVWEYKFNQGGVSPSGEPGWYSDPLNPEQNASDNNNSVLRLTKRFWFEVNLTGSNGFIPMVMASLVHTNADSIVSVSLTNGATVSSPLTVTDVTTYYNPALGVLSYTFPQSIPSTDYVQLLALDATGDSIIYTKTGYNIVYAATPAYIQQGTNLPSVASGDSASFRIDVTGVNLMLMRIAPAGQSLQSVTPVAMNTTPDGSSWWLNMKLTAGTYDYQYQLDNGQLIYDPFGRIDGVNGTEFTVGPAGLSADNYSWHDQSYQRPPLNRLVIEEMHLGEVVGGYYGRPAASANFKDLIPILAHYDSLGVNAIELMPITDFGSVGNSGFSWGYDVNSQFALEPNYGTPADFKTLVDSAHGRGIAIIMDVVFGDMTGAAPLYLMNPDVTSNPYFHANSVTEPNEDTDDIFNVMNHFTPQTQTVVYSALKLWIDQYHVDGFRYDHTKGIGWALNQPQYGVLGWAHKIDSAYNHTVYQIAEHLPESPALIHYSGLTSSWHGAFRQTIATDASGGNAQLSSYDAYVVGLGTYPSPDTPAAPAAYSSRTQPVNCIVDHDELSPVFDMGGDAMAEQRDKVYGTFMFTSPGIPMLWEGVEYGEARGWTNDNERLSYRPVQFSLANTPSGQDHYNYYRHLIYQRLHNPALYQGVLKQVTNYGSGELLVWGFEDTLTNSKVMGVSCLFQIPETLRAVPWLASGTWYNIQNQSTITVSGSTLDSIVMAPYTSYVFSNKSDEELLGVPVKSTNTVPKSFSLLQNFPNPFNPATTIKFTLKEYSQTTLKIYDVLGREVATLVHGGLPAGDHTVTWNAVNEPSGVYFYRITTPAFVDVKKLVLVK
jgi:1,4-alpha-glucan branching enzyme